MEKQMKDRLTSRDVWVRALYMVFFVVAYGVAELVLSLVVLFQFGTILITGSANEPLLRFGHNLSQYVYQILQFQTFNTEDKAFPFSDWPDEAPGDNRWLPSNSAEVTETPASDLPVEPPQQAAAEGHVSDPLDSESNRDEGPDIDADTGMPPRS